MFCRPEILLLHQNIYCHSEICYPDGMHTFANHHYTVKYGHRPTNGSITASYRPTSSYRAHTGFSPCATACIHPAKSFEYVQNVRRVSPAANGQLTCLIYSPTTPLARPLDAGNAYICCRPGHRVSAQNHRLTAAHNAGQRRSPPCNTTCRQPSPEL